jgi:hypothetical protein
MAWEFPAVSQTRVEFWKEPQFTKSGMWWFTLLFGFFGIHHLYLRSPQTAIIFLIANFCSLGFLWFYDLIQLSNVGESLDNLNRHGLNTHVYNMGLAQGMWKEPESLMNSIGKMTGIPVSLQPQPASPTSAPTSAPTAAPTAAPTSAPTAAPTAPAPTADEPTRKERYAEIMSLKSGEQHRREKVLKKMGLPAGLATLGKQSGGAIDEGPPNPIWFLLYCFIIPIAPLAQLVAGDTNNAVSRFLDLTIIPLGFLFYLCAFIYDYMILLIWPADLFVAGSKRFFPFTYLGMDADGHSSRLTGLSEIKPCPADGFITNMFRVSLPIMGIVAPGLAHNIKATLDTATKTKELVIDEGLEKINKATRIAKQASDLSSTLGSLAPMQIPQVQIPQMPQVPQMQIPQMPQMPVPQIPQMPQMPVPQGSNTKYVDATGKRYGTMVGGALPKEPFSPLDYAALGSLGAVIAGGFILSLNRSKNDPPPNPGRV